MDIWAIYALVEQVFADENGVAQLSFLLELLRLTEGRANLRAAHLWATAGPATP